MSPLKVWIAASRPKTLWAGITPVALACAFCASDRMFDPLPALACLIGAMSVQVGTNFVNDYCDFVKGTDNAERIGPLRVMAAGLVSRKAMLRAIVLTYGVTLLCGLYLWQVSNHWLMVITVLGIISGIAYTAGPFPLGYNGLGDLFAFVFFGPVAVMATYYVQAGDLTEVITIVGIAPGAFSVAMITVNNLRDVDGDKASGKRTLAVLLGRTFAKAEYIVAILVACAIPPITVVMSGGHHAALASLLLIVFAIKPIRSVLTCTDGPALNEALAATGKLMLIHTILYGGGWLLKVG
jgi:1,4-dihydroxy-2-naphthoate octaprenyltransferase